MASPAFSINGNPVGTKAMVAAGAAVTATLDSTVGVRSVAWTLIRTDELSLTTDYTLVQSGPVGQQCDTTALGAGRSAALQCTINGGIDTATGAPSDAMTAVVKFYVPMATSFEVLNAGELEDDNRESSSTHGAVDPLNKIIRAAATIAGAYKDPVRAATAVALAAYTRIGNVITANGNGIMAAVDGVTLIASNDMLLKNGAAGADNGPYTVTNVGSAGTPFVLTRRSDADTTGELVAGSIIPVAEGTANAEQLFILTTNDPITINTTAQTWTNWGVVAPLVTAALRGTVNVLGAGNNVLTTDGATPGGTWGKIVDALVDVAAAIAGTKIAAAFGNQVASAQELHAVHGGGTAAFLELRNGATAAISGAGNVRIRNNAGVPEISRNAGPYAELHGGPGFVSFAFRSPSAGGATFWAGGYYAFAGAANDFNPPVTLGTANSARGAHVALICDVSPGAGTTVRISGTSITSAGVRTAADTEDIAFAAGDPVSTYRQTTKLWIGQVTLTKTVGSDRLCNYGFVKAFDMSGVDFILRRVNVSWLAGASDAGIELRVRHHKTTGWTYQAAAVPTPPAAIVDMAADYGVESEAVNGEQGWYHRSGLSTTIAGSTGEGIMLEITTSVANAFQNGTVAFQLEVV